MLQLVRALGESCLQRIRQRIEGEFQVPTDEQRFTWCTQERPWCRSNEVCMNPMASWPLGTLRMLTHVYGGVSPVFPKPIELSSCKCNLSWKRCIHTGYLFMCYPQIDTRGFFILVLVMNNFAILILSICRIINAGNLTFTIVSFWANFLFLQKHPLSELTRLHFTWSWEARPVAQAVSPCNIPVSASTMFL